LPSFFINSGTLSLTSRPAAITYIRNSILIRYLNTCNTIIEQFWFKAN
jgi:hypothetical protein